MFTIIWDPAAFHQTAELLEVKLESGRQPG